MRTRKIHRNALFAAAHECALGLRHAGVIDEQTMKAFDEMCLTPVKALSLDKIRRNRTRKKPR